MSKLLELFAIPSPDATPFISPATVHNIKLPTVLRLCLSEDQVQAVTAFLQRPFDQGTLPKRQGFFEAFLYSDSMQTLFKETQSALVYAHRLAEQYEKEKNNDMKNFLFFRCMDMLLTALSVIADATGGGEKTISIYSDFTDRLKTFCATDATKQAIQDLNAIRKTLRDVTAQTYEVRLYGSFMTDYRTVPVPDGSLDQQLLDLFKAMNMGVANPPIQREIRDSTFNTYVGMLMKSSVQLRGTLSTYHSRHMDLYNHIMPLDFSDISIALNIHTLFEYFTDKQIPHCFPAISTSRAAHIHDFYDISLLTQKIPAIIPNDYICSDGEAVFILTGVNSGGKTTYLRGLGLAITFFAAGIFVPATSATIPVYDRMEALFAGRSNVKARERFQQEREMVNDAIESMTATSMLLVNEIFSSIDEKTAVDEYSRVIKILQQKGCHSLLITHLHSLAQGVALPNIVSLTAMVGENSERTYKIKRFQGRSSNVMEILNKYGLGGHGDGSLSSANHGRQGTVPVSAERSAN